MRVIPCKTYVAVHYIPCTTQADGVREFRRWSEEQGEETADFVEALSYSEDTMVVVSKSKSDAAAM